jgi:hypothetical protein
MMNPALTMSLADQHRRELTARSARLRAGQHRSRSRAPRVLVPGFRVTWTRLSLAPADAGRRRSWVIVISATRAQ